MNTRRRSIHRPLIVALLTFGFYLLVSTPAVAFAACGDPPGPGVDWSGCDKSGANLKDLDLTGAILVGTDFTGASLNGATLTGADLTGAILQDAKAQGTNFINAIVTNMNVANTDFKAATLLGATGDVDNGDQALFNGTTCPSGAIVPPGACWAPAAITLQPVSVQPTFTAELVKMVVALLFAAAITVLLIGDGRPPPRREV